MRQVKCLLGEKNRKHRRAERERERGVCFGGWFKPYGGSSSRFLLANQLALSGSESISGLTQGPPLCARVSFSQDGFQRKGLWEVNRTYYGLAPPPFNLSAQA